MTTDDTKSTGDEPRRGEPNADDRDRPRADRARADGGRDTGNVSAQGVWGRGPSRATQATDGGRSTETADETTGDETTTDERDDDCARGSEAGTGRVSAQGVFDRGRTR